MLAALAGIVLGFIVGLPSLRVRGPHLAIMTLAIALALYDFVFTNGQLMGSKGYLQLGGYPQVGSWSFDQRSYAILCLFILAGVLVMVSLVRRSRFGLKSLLIRESERSAIIAGIDVTKQKLLIFMLSSAIAAVGGALIAHAQLVFSYESYAVIESLLLFVVAYIGGIGMAVGAVITGLGATGGIFSNVLSLVHITRYQELIAGVVLLIALQLHPDGMATLPHTIGNAIRRRRTARKEEVTLVPDPLVKAKALERN
jgi:branched-chain amino acid transport system permease protein